jgi:DNA (cytosine-5)-methyltransferase 1
MIDIKFVDLFAGIGGFRQAAKHAKLEGINFIPVGACEIDAACRKLYQEIFRTRDTDEVFVNDIKNISSTDCQLSKEESDLPNFDLLFAGFPCQPFSNAGRRLGLNDPRGGLFFDITALLFRYKPKYFILENVQKLATVEKGKTLQLLIKHLEDADYHVHLWDLYADDYGLPQKRRRLFFCGVRKSHARNKRELGMPEPVERKYWKYPTAWHLLEKEMPLQHIVPEKTRATVFKRNPKWQGTLDIDCPIAKPICASMAKWHRANQDNYYSATYVRPDNPDPYMSPEVDIETEVMRRITPLEGFRLQGFPDEYAEACEKLKLSYVTRYRMIGNAVPVNLAQRVIEHFMEAYA